MEKKEIKTVEVHRLIYDMLRNGSHVVEIDNREYIWCLTGWARVVKISDDKIVMDDDLSGFPTPYRRIRITEFHCGLTNCVHNDNKTCMILPYPEINFFIEPGICSCLNYTTKLDRR